LSRRKPDHPVPAIIFEIDVEIVKIPARRTHDNDVFDHWLLQSQRIIALRPLKNAPFCPISLSGSNFNPQNTQCIPVVKIFAFLELEQK
jgi:hypothetical protein